MTILTLKKIGQEVVATQFYERPASIQRQYYNFHFARAHVSLHQEEVAEENGVYYPPVHMKLNLDVKQCQEYAAHFSALARKMMETEE